MPCAEALGHHPVTTPFRQPERKKGSKGFTIAMTITNNKQSTNKQQGGRTTTNKT